MANAINKMDDLIIELHNYCTSNGLPHMSADELAAEDCVSTEQRAWLLSYGKRWEAMADEEYNERKEMGQ